MENQTLAQWEKTPTSTILQFIVDYFHFRLNSQFLEIPTLFKNVIQTQSTPDLVKSFHLFSQFANQMEFHLIQEETIVFPLIRSIDKENTSENLKKLFPFIMAMEKDHQEDVVFINELKSLTKDFRQSESASDNLISLFKSLKVLIQDLEMHIKIENEIVFERFKIRDLK